MDVRGLFYILSGAQVPYYRLDLSQWFALDAVPEPQSEIFQKTIEMDGREVEVCVSKAGNKHEMSGIILVTPIEIMKGHNNKMMLNKYGKFGFWAKPLKRGPR